MGQLMLNGTTVRGLKVPTLKGAEASLFYAQCFFYLVSSSINTSIPSGQTSYMLCMFTHVYYNPVSLAARFMDVTQTILIILTMVGVF